MRVGIFSGEAVADDAALLARVKEAPQMVGAEPLRGGRHQGDVRRPRDR